ncbi:MAG: relaxase/mobilization nuclease domain-containing protein [Mailhella sp.]|nr:relaxase/mobilization nuclease domain-containing protein [Mailhella sp.]
MIVKKMKRTNFSKSKAVMISELVDYIFASHDDQGKEKLAHFGTLNFLTTIRSAQKNEMIALAEESVQSKMPVAHWVLSWKDGEQPTPEKVDFAVRYFLQLMEWKEHQAFYAVHKNTSNLHVHIVVNRVNPDTLKVHRPNRGFDIDRAHLAIAKLERIEGWASEENSVYEPAQFGNYLSLSKRDYPKLCPAAETLENATGEKSAQRIARERGHSIIMKATSWRALHEELAEVGLRFEKKGSGALVWVGDVAVKASSVDRAFSMPKLVKKLGEFEYGDYAVERTSFKPAPVTEAETMFKEDWQEYQQERAAEKKKRALIQNRKKDAFQRWEEERKARKHGVYRKLSRYGLPIMNIGRHFLKEQQEQEKSKFRQTVKTQGRPCIETQSFRRWLARNGSRKSILWRQRKRLIPGLHIEKFTFSRTSDFRPYYEGYLQKAQKKLGEHSDGSRIDAEIALRMRLDGYDINTSINTILAESEWAKIRTTREERLEYASRIARVSFGTVGDVTIAKQKAEEERRKRSIPRSEESEGYAFSPRMR